jgi:hypothetical protein
VGSGGARRPVPAAGPPPGVPRPPATPTRPPPRRREIGITRNDNIIPTHKLEHHIRADLDATSARTLAVLHPLRCVVTNLADDHVEQVQAKHFPGREDSVYTVPFSKVRLAGGGGWRWAGCWPWAGLVLGGGVRCLPLPGAHAPLGPGAAPSQAGPEHVLRQHRHVCRPLPGPPACVLAHRRPAGPPAPRAAQVLYIESTDFREQDSKDYYGLAPGKAAMLRYGYPITCKEVVKDAAGGRTAGLGGGGGPVALARGARAQLGGGSSRGGACCTPPARHQRLPTAPAARRPWLGRA